MARKRMWRSVALGSAAAVLAVLLVAAPAGAVGGYGVAWTGGLGLNVRSGPGTGHGIVGNMPDGTGVELDCWEHGTWIGRLDTWYRISAPYQGYVTAAYITTPSDPLPGLPECGAVVQAEPASEPSVEVQPDPEPAPPPPMNGYPYVNAPDCNEFGPGGCVVDAWGFFQGQCTSYVAFMLRQRGVPFSNWYGQPSGYRFGNAGSWQHAARRAGFAVDNRPRPGDVGEFGFHVVYVHEVRGDGSIVYSDMNSDYHNAFRGAVVAYPGTRAYPLRFLHIGN